MGKKSILITAIYRSPTTDTDDFVSQLKEYTQKQFIQTYYYKGCKFGPE